VTAEIVKFPYRVSRRVSARKPRRSKNGSPEDQAAKATVADPVVPAESLELWSEAGHLLRKLSERNMLWAAVECMRLLMQEQGQRHEAPAPVDPEAKPPADSRPCKAAKAVTCSQRVRDIDEASRIS
jgi:hypothetical protein